MLVIDIFMLPGFFVINPNSSKVLLLFGAYRGTIKVNGFYWVIPFYTRFGVSLKARNFESERLKVNDKLGNPIMISSILVRKVDDTYKAMFEVDDYEASSRFRLMPLSASLPDLIPMISLKMKKHLLH
jgi:regulator of protease activity HflC (stomatin/prohibitin superfamily)